MSGVAVADELARDRDARARSVRCFDRPLWVEAGAGTGKTTALVGRMLAWSLGPGWDAAAQRLDGEGRPAPGPEEIAAEAFRRIVAITFTEAAAAEMAQRAARVLRALADGTVERELEDARLPADSDVRGARARALLASLDRLVVRTIHAFARRLLAAHPFEAGLPPDFTVDSDGLAAGAVVRELLEDALAAGYGAPGDPVLLGLAKCGVAPEALERELLDLVAADTSPELLEADPFDAVHLAALCARVRSGLSELARAAAGRLEGIGQRGASGEAMVRAQRLAAALEEDPGSGVAAFVRLQQRLASELGDSSRRLERWARPSPDFKKAEVAALGDDGVTAVHDAAAAVWPWLKHVAAIDAPLLDLARRALAPLLRLAHERLAAAGSLGFDGLLRRARALLERHEAVAAAVRAEIDLLLVDEFQDTDREQCGLVAALALAGPVARRPRLYVVGDPKQSIYAWRSAELEAYEGFRERVLAEGGASHTLVRNHRSLPGVLDDVTRVIAPVMSEEPGLQPAFQRLLAAREGPAPGSAGLPCVEYWVSSDPELDGRTPSRRAAAIEAEALAHDLVRLLRDHAVRPRDVAVLLRSLGDVDTYLEPLRRAGIPYQVASDRRFYRRREIVDASAALRCVLDPHDAVALLAFLRSPMVGVPDAALIPLWAEGLPGLMAALPGGPELERRLASAGAAAARALPEGVPGLGPVAGFEARLQRAAHVLSSLRTSFAEEPAARFVERLRRSLLPEVLEAARPLGAFRLANLERFFRAATDLLEDGADAAEALRQIRRNVADERDLEDGGPQEAAEDAVQVLSIHRAKGLGFDHVYLMQTHKGRGPRDREACVVPTAAGSEMRLLGQESPGFRTVREWRARVDACERVRTLYVAMTRARDRLVIAGAWRPDGGVEPESQLALVSRRRGARAEPFAWVEKLRPDPSRGIADPDGVLWRFPALEAAQRVERGAAPPALEPATEEAGGEPAARVRDDVARLGALGEAADARSRRPFGGPASAGAHEAFAEDEAARREGEAPAATSGASAPERRVARAVGTAVHRALECLELEGAEAEARVRAMQEAERALAALLPDAACAGAREELERVLDGFFAGPLHGRLRALAPRILGREVPILLPGAPDVEGPVGFVAGAVDLVYRDPDDDEVVVADHKTDRISDPEARHDQALRYARQGLPYVQAVADALGLERLPRFELWWLREGRIEPVSVQA